MLAVLPAPLSLRATALRPLPGRTAPIMRRPQLMAAMVLALAAVLALAVWDERREARAALDDFAAEQTALARSATLTLLDRVRSPECANPGSPCLLEALAAIGGTAQQPGAARVLVRAPGQPLFLGTAGQMLAAPSVQAALDRGLS